MFPNDVSMKQNFCHFRIKVSSKNVKERAPSLSKDFLKVRKLYHLAVPLRTLKKAYGQRGEGQGSLFLDAGHHTLISLISHLTFRLILISGLLFLQFCSRGKVRRLVIHALSGIRIS